MIRYTIAITTDASGVATVYTSGAAANPAQSTDNANGRVASVQYVKTDFANGVSMAITGETTGTEILTIAGGSMNASDSWRPTKTADTTAGVENADGLDYPAIIEERIKIVIAAGGDTKTGTVHIVVE